MPEIRPPTRFTRWIAAGVMVCFVLIALRAGFPIYRRKQAIDKLQRLGTVISTQARGAPAGALPSAAWWQKAVPESWLPAFENVISVRNEHRTAESFEIARINATFGYARNSRNGVRELLETLRQFPELQWLNLDGSPLVDDDLAELAELKNLECVVFANTRISGTGLAYLSRLPKLKSLDISHTDVDDAALEQVSKMTSLESLRIDGAHISNAGLQHLAQLPRLHELSCSSTQVTDAGLDELLNTHRQLSVTDD
jgi:hypothetical protein